MTTSRQPGAGRAPIGGSGGRALPAAMNDSMSVRAAADRLGVHYMTAYRYVREGLLEARKVGAEWRITPQALARLALLVDRPGRGGLAPLPMSGDSSVIGSDRRSIVARRQLEHRLVAGDERGCWAVVGEEIKRGYNAADVHVELIAAALEAIEDGRAGGAYDDVEVRRAGALALRIVSRLGVHFATPGRRRGLVVVGGVEGDRRAVPIAMAADQLRGAVFDVLELGPDVPAESFVKAARLAPLALVVFASCGGLEPAVGSLMGGLGSPRPVLVLLAGSGVRAAADALRLGADGFAGSDIREIVKAVSVIANGRAAISRARGAASLQAALGVPRGGDDRADASHEPAMPARARLTPYIGTSLERAALNP